MTDERDRNLSITFDGVHLEVFLLHMIYLLLIF